MPIPEKPTNTKYMLVLAMLLLLALLVSLITIGINAVQKDSSYGANSYQNSRQDTQASNMPPLPPMAPSTLPPAYSEANMPPPLP